MEKYISKYTSQEVDKRLQQGAYDDAVAAGFVGTKDEFDKRLTKVGEEVTGNITTHSHDTIIEGVTEVDVWDGVAISTSLKGLGSREDPYQINSCADFIYFNKNGRQLSDSSISINAFNINDYTDFSRFAVINKNLDFNNHKVNYSLNLSIPHLILFDVNGNGAEVKGFVSDTTSSIFITSFGSYFHDISLVGTKLTMDLSMYYYDQLASMVINPVSLNTSISTGLGLLNISHSSEIRLIDSSESVLLSNPIQLSSCSGVMNSIPFLTLDKIYFSSKLKIINELDVTSRVVLITNEPVYTSRRASLTCELIGYDASEFLEMMPETQPTNGFFKVFSFMHIFNGKLYLDSSQVPYPVLGGSGFETTVESLPTSTMTSPEFINTLNSSSVGKIWKSDTKGLNGGYPVIDRSAVYQEVTYDGYVHSTEFNEVRDSAVTSLSIRSIVSLTQVDYDAIVVKDPTTLYIII